MEWLMILLPAIIMFAIAIYNGSICNYDDFCDFLMLELIIIIVSGVLNLLIGLAIEPNYNRQLSKSQQLYPVTINGQIQNNKYYIIKPNSNVIIVNTGKEQKELDIGKINNNTSKHELTTYSYTWDDTKFPYNLFITQEKSNEQEIIVPKDSGIIDEK